MIVNVNNHFVSTSKNDYVRQDYKDLTDYDINIVNLIINKIHNNKKGIIGDYNYFLKGELHYFIGMNILMLLEVSKQQITKRYAIVL